MLSKEHRTYSRLEFPCSPSSIVKIQGIEEHQIGEIISSQLIPNDPYEFKWAVMKMFYITKWK